MPQKLKLKISESLQGNFELGDLNLMVVFQVNCPGCFIYALPAAIKIYEQFREQDVKMMGLSTAFEDYELNTLENTKRLLASGEIVGETKKALSKAGYPKFPLKIPFAVAFDELTQRTSATSNQEVNDYCQTLTGYSSASAAEKKISETQVRDYLSKKQYHAYTFDSNLLQGTPSWILFDNQKTIFYQGFGDKPYESLVKKIGEHLK